MFTSDKCSFHAAKILTFFFVVAVAVVCLLVCLLFLTEYPSCLFISSLKYDHFIQIRLNMYLNMDLNATI